MKNIFSVLTILLIFTCTALSQGFEQGPYQDLSLGSPQVYDMNGDGKLDVIGMQYSYANDASKINIQINNSDQENISFEENKINIYFSGGCGIGDFDNDGDFDIITSRKEDQQTLILYNNGDATFLIDSITTNNIRSYRTGDIDNDGDVDIIAFNINDGTIYILSNEGQGEFTNIELASGLSDLANIDLGDLDGDGDVDILIAIDNFWDGKIIKLENQGNLTFEESLIIDDGAGSLDNIKIVDINKDGFVDILYSCRGSYRVFLLQNNNNVSYKTSKIITSGSGFIRSFAVEDFDTDGILDLITGCNSGDVSFHKGKSNENLAYDVTKVSSIQPVYSIITGDLDNDEDLDVVLSNGEFWWLDNVLNETVGNVNTTYGTFDIYPNPFINTLHIKNAERLFDIQISNMEGQIVFTSTKNQHTNLFELSFLKKGTYFVIITSSISGKILENKKVIKLN